MDSLASQYQAAMSPGVRSYLHGRGIDDAAIARYRVGEVSADSEHGSYAGMICFPYLTKLGGVVSLKFRQSHDCTEACDYIRDGKTKRHSKYIGPYDTRLYNTLAMDRADELGFIGICEGEIDALTLDYHCGIPAVGIPGVEVWKKHPEWKELFRGYRDVYVFEDTDESGKGHELAVRVVRDIQGAHLVTLTSGKDANEAFLAKGIDEIKRKAGLSS